MDYIKENIKEFSLVNLFQWHNLGYTGKGINIGNTEKAYPDHPLFDGKLRPDSGYLFTKKENDHGNKTAHVLHQIAPDANIYPISLLNNFSNGKMSGAFPEITIPLIKEKNISVISSSAYMPSSVKRVSEVLGTMRDKTVLVASAGNSGFDGLGGYGSTEEWMGVGAIGWSDENNNIFLKSYSSRGPELNYTNFSGLAIPNFGENYPGKIQIWDGTSFSGPKHAGLCALIQQFFLDNAGRTLSHFEMDAFLMDHLVDLGNDGWDDAYGHGFLVLPDPKTIVIEKYVKDYNPEPTPEPPIVVPPVDPPKEEPPVVISPTEPVKEYYAGNKIKGYMDATSAINGGYAVANLPIGVYYIYKTHTNGAINITRDSTGQAPGWWINPKDNIVSPPVEPEPPKEEPPVEPEPPIVVSPVEPTVEEYHVVSIISGYNTASNAISGVSPVANLDIGIYYVYKTFTNGAINITKDSTAQKAGWWINPDDNKFVEPKYFDDLDGTPYENAVKDLVDSGVLIKDSSVFNGDKNITRGETAILLNNLRLYLEKKVE